MFDAMKFNGDKITKRDFVENIECYQLLGVYPVKLEFDEDGNAEYTVSDNPTGKLMVFKDESGETVVMYFNNSVETSCLVDLL